MRNAAQPLKLGDKLTPFSFGVAGVDTWDEIVVSSSTGKRLGIIRNVQYDHDNNNVSGVRYVFDAVKGEIGCKWRKSSAPGCWQVDLGTQRDPQSLKNYTSLAQFSLQLRTRFDKSGHIEKNDDDLRLLDEFVQGILGIAKLLHLEKQLVGALTPENAISFFDENAKRRIMLPDAGFRWHGAPPGPPWIKKLDNDWGELWLPHACDKFQSRDWSSLAEYEDVVLLARLLLWVLTGSIDNSDQVIRNEFARRIKQTSTEVPAGCWAVLYQVIATADELKAIGLPQIRTAADLADKLKVSPLSEHFLYCKPARSSWFSVKMVVTSLIIFSLLGGVSFVALNPDLASKIVSCIVPPPPLRNPLCPECAHPSSFLPILDEMEPLVKSLESSIAVGGTPDVQSYDKAIREGLDQLNNLDGLLTKLRTARESSPGNKEQELACLEKLEARFLELLDGLGRSFYASAQNGNVVDQQGIGQSLVEAYDKWNGTTTLEKPEWYQMIRKYFLD